MADAATLIAELTRAKAVFQLRTIAAIITNSPAAPPAVHLAGEVIPPASPAISSPVHEVTNA